MNLVPPRRAVIVDVVRSPFVRARAGGAFANLHPVDLFARVLKGLIERTGIDPAAVEDVIAGCVLQVGEQSGNIARNAWLAAGFPDSTPGVTLDRKCGSAQQALDFAASGIVSGTYDLVVAGGIEMMSVVPMRANRLGKDNYGESFRERYPAELVHQGVSAELIAAKWNLSREAQDAFALGSHRSAAAAEDRDLRKRDIVPIEIRGEDGTLRVVERDDGLRRDTSAARLASLAPAFASDAMSERFPEIAWSVTAGNASQVSDGASALLLAEERVAERLGLRPRAAVVRSSVAGADPLYMLTAIMPATERLLARSGLGIADIDVFEVNEAFASVVLAWLAETGADPAHVNVDGGAIALGHPVGASGGRLTANLLGALEERGGRYGMQIMCESGGTANATLFERL
jgi:acetyl-CoA acetyltransferase family protein